MLNQTCLHNSFVRSCRCSFVCSIVCSFDRLFIRSFIHSLIHSYIHSFINLIIKYSIIHFLHTFTVVNSLVNSFACSFPMLHVKDCAFVQSFMLSIVRLFNSDKVVQLLNVLRCSEMAATPHRRSLLSSGGEKHEIRRNKCSHFW